MTEIAGILAGIVITFMVFVLPIWLFLHYLTRMRASRGLSAADEQALAELWDMANRIEERLRSLETILDDRAPDWRNRK